MSLGYFYKGATTGNLYGFANPLVDPEGNQIVGGQFSTVFYNGPLFPTGETLVYANRDGSVAQPVTGPGVQVPSSQVSIGDITLPTVTPSAWEEA